MGQCPSVLKPAVAAALQMMQNLTLAEGDIIRLRSAALPKGSYVKIQPHTTDFINISNPKVGNTRPSGTRRTLGWTHNGAPALPPRVLCRVPRGGDPGRTGAASSLRRRRAPPFQASQFLRTGNWQLPRRVRRLRGF